MNRVEEATGRLRTLFRSDVIRLMGMLALGKLVVFVSAFLVFGGSKFLYAMSTRWDSAWYLAIAKSGYTGPGVVYSPTSYARLYPNAFAFSPSFPTLIGWLTPLTGTYWASGLIIANALSFLIPYVIYKTFGFRVALLAELFPVYLVFTTIPYSESVFLLFLALAVFLALRGRMFLSSGSLSMAIFGAYGLAFTLPSFLLAFVRRYRQRSVLFYALPLVTGGLLLLWFQLVSGSYTTFFTVESVHWRVSFADPIQQISWLLGHSSFNLGLWPMPGIWLTRNLPFEAFYIFGALYLIRMRAENWVFLSAFSFSVILPILSVIGGPALSVPRLLLPAFPVFVAYAHLIRGRTVWLYCGVCLPLTVWVTLSQMLYFFS